MAFLGNSRANWSPVAFFSFLRVRCLYLLALCFFSPFISFISSMFGGFWGISRQFAHRRVSGVPFFFRPFRCPFCLYFLYASPQFGVFWAFFGNSRTDGSPAIPFFVNLFFVFFALYFLYFPTAWGFFGPFFGNSRANGSPAFFFSPFISIIFARVGGFGAFCGSSRANGPPVILFFARFCLFPPLFPLFPRCLEFSGRLLVILAPMGRR